ncbi:MAG: hypothetical protein GY953_22445 [bacterium]|nr:hypothetical protein [bacterium]
MRLRHLMIANAAGAVTFGVLFALWAPNMLRYYGASFGVGADLTMADNLWTAVSFARLAGALSVCFGILLWAVRDIGPSQTQRRMAVALLVANSAAFLTAGAQQIAIWESTMGNLTVASFFLFALGYTHYLFGALKGDGAHRRFA